MKPLPLSGLCPPCAGLQPLAALLPLAIILSCSKIPEGRDASPDTMFFESWLDDSATRSSIDGDLHVHWESGDALNVMGVNTDVRAELSSFSDGGRKAVFRAAGISPYDSELYAFHPYRSGAAKPSVEGRLACVRIPDRQDGTFASSNICMARLEDRSVFRFHNLAALLEFSVSDAALAASTRKIEVSAPAGEGVAGVLKADFESFSDPWPTSTSRTLTLVPERVAAGMPLYAGVLPGKYASGIRLRLLDAAGKQLKMFECPAPMNLAGGTLVRLGGISAARRATSFHESFSACNGTGGNDGRFSAANDGQRLSRSNASLYCDNPGWDFHNVSVADRCVQFTAPAGEKAWMLSPPLGIEGDATVSLRGSYFQDAYYGLEFRVVGDGVASVRGSTSHPQLFAFSMINARYGAMYDIGDVRLKGLTPDSRLMISTANTSRNHSHIDEIDLVPGAEPFEYLILERKSLTVPAMAGRYRIRAAVSPGVETCITSHGAFLDCATGKAISVNGKGEYPTVYFENSSKDPGLVVSVRQNTTGKRRKVHINLDARVASSTFEFIQEAE